MPKDNQEIFDHCPCVGSTLDKLIQPAVLAMLTEEPIHGYELAKKIAAIPHFLDDAPDISGIYRILKSLEARSMVSSHWDISQGGRPKRLFSITDDGRRCLERWNITLKQYHESIGSLLKTTQKAAR